MDKTTQDLAWRCLPREFREEVKIAYKRLTSPNYLKDSIGRVMKILLEDIFDLHNLTSDAEGEEMLCVSRKRVQEEYRESIGKAHPYNLNSYNRGFHVGCATMLKELFGSKCKPDEAPLSQNPVENCDSEPHISTDCDKPAEPKFTVGDRAVVRGFKHPLLKQDGAIVTILSYHEKGDFYSCAIAPNVGIDVDAKCLEPCTEPTFTDDCQSQSKSQSRNLSQETANCDKQLDNIPKDGFAKERRLKIAAMMAQGILSNTDRMKQYGEIAMRESETLTQLVARNAMRYADALIAECEAKH